MPIKFYFKVKKINGRNYISISYIKFNIMIKRCFSGGCSAINHIESSMVDLNFIPIFVQFSSKIEINGEFKND